MVFKGPDPLTQGAPRLQTTHTMTGGRSLPTFSQGCGY